MSTRALKAVTVGSRQTTRQLSMTGSATSSSLLTTDKPVVGRSAPRLPVSTQFPIPDTTDTGKIVRHFNTSRSMKAVNDSSTIDFMFIPDFDPDTRSAPVQIRVPILPWTDVSETTKASIAEPEQQVRHFTTT